MSKIYQARMSRRESIKRLSAMTAVVMVGGVPVACDTVEPEAPQATAADPLAVSPPDHEPVAEALPVGVLHVAVVIDPICFDLGMIKKRHRVPLL